jgi:hypothetical protein
MWPLALIACFCARLIENNYTYRVINMNGLKEISDSAVSLSGNPLGIIALFIVLVYGVAALVAGFSGRLKEGERTPIIWFLALFPCLVLAVFGWLVSQHHDKLYGPRDYTDESHFVSTFTQEKLKQFAFAERTQNIELDSDSNGFNWSEERQNVYLKNDKFFLAHIIEPSKKTDSFTKYLSTSFSTRAMTSQKYRKPSSFSEKNGEIRFLLAARLTNILV